MKNVLIGIHYQEAGFNELWFIEKIEFKNGEVLSQLTNNTLKALQLTEDTAKPYIALVNIEFKNSQNYKIKVIKF